MFYHLSPFLFFLYLGRFLLLLSFVNCNWGFVCLHNVFYDHLCHLPGHLFLSLVDVSVWDESLDSPGYLGTGTDKSLMGTGGWTLQGRVVPGERCWIRSTQKATWQGWRKRSTSLWIKTELIRPSQNHPNGGWRVLDSLEKWREIRKWGASFASPCSARVWNAEYE